MKQTNPYIFLRGLRQTDHTVFCVENGQKVYEDPCFKQLVAYSSGQQVKRSILDALVMQLGKLRAPITFNYEINKHGQVKEGGALVPADPQYPDLLIGGWMYAQKVRMQKKKNVEDSEDSQESKVIKRRSPLSVSALRPLHPLLVSDYKEVITIDRGRHPELSKIHIFDETGKPLSEEEAAKVFEGSSRPSWSRHFHKDQRRTSGLFMYDVAIDLRRLFRVSLTRNEPEIPSEMVNILLTAGWTESSDGYDLICPADRREEIIPAIANSLINWRVTSNQSRTYSPQATLAIAVAGNANAIVGSIRADLNEGSERLTATPVIEEIDGVNLFVAPACKGYVADVVASNNALEQAERHIIELLRGFDYEYSSVATAV